MPTQACQARLAPKTSVATRIHPEANKPFHSAKLRAGPPARGPNLHVIVGRDRLPTAILPGWRDGGLTERDRSHEMAARTHDQGRTAP